VARGRHVTQREADVARVADDHGSIWCSVETTPCSQSQIGPVGYLQRRGTALVELVVALSVIVRWGPVKTAVNGTVVARPPR
jgi:hypothetical protein